MCLLNYLDEISTIYLHTGTDNNVSFHKLINKNEFNELKCRRVPSSSNYIEILVFFKNNL